MATLCHPYRRRSFMSFGKLLNKSFIVRLTKLNYHQQNEFRVDKAVATDNSLQPLLAALS